MDRIEDVSIVECEDSFYIKPARMIYTQNGIKKNWDLMRTHDSVAVVIFNIDKKSLVFVKQFRPAVYYRGIPLDECKDLIDTKKYPGTLGVTLELCAGIVDKDQSLEEIVKEEMWEECGFDVPLSNIEKITSFRSGVGITGSLQTLFYAEVTNAMKTHQGGGNSQEGEYIEVIELPLSEAHQLIYDEMVPRPVSLLFALMWFFDKKINFKHLPKL
ncbi:uridine diphosphate glucose pyrophosphatase-like [Centruroides sculpturatus]|uniref:uridine diphosphate glucose pyrophosphatase-like n=1 Tax=Centruroides sculpturatus TaxID=218467 RepID=UPI000C6E800D|nr:uridine diphosphate glucose pyrophosphatase-like [Centruroides sculpturatus]